MKEFDYTISDPEGIHARPAGLLVKEASKYNSEINLIKGKKSADAKRIFSVMGLGIKCKDTIKLTVDGNDEDIACKALETFFKENL